MALKLRDYLQEAGALVIMTREEDVDLADAGTAKIRQRKTEDLRKRAMIINDSEADAFLSIHMNAIPSERWNGAQTFYHLKTNAMKIWLFLSRRKSNAICKILIDTQNRSTMCIC